MTLHQTIFVTSIFGSPGRWFLRIQTPPIQMSIQMLPRDPSTFSGGDWRHCYVGLEGPVVPSDQVLGSLGALNIKNRCAIANSQTPKFDASKPENPLPPAEM